MYQLLEKNFGILLIGISIAIAVYLIPSLWPILKRTPYELLEPNAGIRHKLRYDWFMQSIGWIIAYFAFRGGRAFLRDSKKPPKKS